MGEANRQAGETSIVSRAITVPIPCHLMIEADDFGTVHHLTIQHTTAYDAATRFALQRALFWVVQQLCEAGRAGELAVDVLARLFPPPAEAAADIAMIERSLLREVVAVQTLRVSAIFGGEAHG